MNSSRRDEVLKELRRREVMEELQKRESEEKLKNRSFGDKALQIGKDIGNAGIDTILGAGDALRDLPMQIADLIPGVDTRKYQTPSASGGYYQAGNLAGNLATFLGGGELFQGARALGAASKAPAAIKAAKIASSSPAINRILGGAALGGITNEDNRLTGSLLGGGLAGAFEVPSAVRKITDYIRPTKYAKEIIDHLGAGNSLENNAKSLSLDLNRLYNTKKTEAEKLYVPIFSNSSVANNSIYRKINPSGYYEYLEKPQIAIPKASTDIKELIEKFDKNPNLENAHKLQSDIGKEIKDLSLTNAKSGLNSEDKELLKNYSKTRSHLKDQINSFLESKNPDLATQYKEATKYYAENLGHYLDNKKIREIATGKIKNPKNISNVFKNPEPGIEKIANDLGPEGKNKILYAAIGHNKNTVNAEKLAREIEKLDKKGLESYLTRETAQIFNNFSKKTKYRDMAQSIGSIIAAGSLGHSIGGDAGALAGSIMGGWKGPSAIKNIQKLTERK
jgi:hypothetical protein